MLTVLLLKTYRGTKVDRCFHYPFQRERVDKGKAFISF
ncbi:hypothetical protein PORCAN_358 [Porphyromonas crevioricanis JCM 13913]|nr:hypothetical protein PORCAN_358 [Porphyromonas crevioricanis JCM 13913]